jgi:hypothetical protein
MAETTTERGATARRRRKDEMFVVAPVMLLLVFALNGCASDQLSPPAQSHTLSAQAAPNDDDDDDDDRAATSLRLLAEELNSARLASRKAETMPAVTSPLARREILLHVALYRAAYQTRVSKLDHIILEPVSESDPPDIGIDPEEFRLRILGALDDLPSPLAWITETWRRAAIDYFPNTDERATRLRITILQRRDDEGVVVGEISDWTADLGASKQKVTCTWDGLAWNLERDRVRVEW